MCIIYLNSLTNHHRHKSPKKKKRKEKKKSFINHNVL